MELDRAVFHGNLVHRDGVLRHLDVSIKEIRAMKEVTIVMVILILAVIAWRPRKGGK